MTSGGSVLALVPVRSLRDGKTRLAGDLAPETREALTRRMLRGVVRAALDSGTVATVGVVSPDPAVLSFAGRLDPAVVPLAQDPDSPGLNPAIDAGRRWAMDRGAASLLTLLGDLPLLAPADVRAVTEGDGLVVLGRDRHGAGTNALLLRLDGAGPDFRFGFGAGSFRRHLAEAERLRLTVAVVDRPGTAVDLDTPEDLRLVLGDDQREGDATLLAATAVGAEDDHP
ncbi:MAG: 2-phospho-L-lactate guanylyltransferase [Chloroflexota bacterium]|nr:2-phospho-L-lactate guanylyltransferase [Chloroflexota bacterium]